MPRPAKGFEGGVCDPALLEARARSLREAFEASDLAPVVAELYGEAYFERGRELGISWYTNYRWMPERSHAEARAFLDAMGFWELASERPVVVDYGCAKGFFVRALVEQGFSAFGVDLSRYALSRADACVRGRLFHVEEPFLRELKFFPADLGFCKDTLEHVAPEALPETLALLKDLARRWLVIVPLADPGPLGPRYRIPEYECDVTHQIRADERFWVGAFEAAGFRLPRLTHHVPGLKDPWWEACPTGNFCLFATSERSPA